MSENTRKRIVVIGGVAAGPKAASRIKRLQPDADVTLIEKGSILSYAGCGLPYFISGTVKERDELYATPIGVPRDAAFFEKVKQFRVLSQTEAREIDRAGKRIKVSGPDGESWLNYDILVLATGASPIIPPIPGVELDGIHSLKSVEDADRFKSILDRDEIKRTVIVGGGLIGLEMAETLVERGRQVTLVEMLPQILPMMLDWEMAKFVENHLKAKGVEVLTETKVESFTGKDRVQTVETSNGSPETDLVVMAIGVRPNVGLAKASGLELGSTGAIKVDETMRTSDESIFAAGDCVEGTDLQTGKPCYIPLGSTANKQGRVVANSICGVPDRFPGVLGSAVCKVLGVSVARTGLSEQTARDLGHNVVTCLSPGPDIAHYYPGNQPIIIKLIVDTDTRKLLGVQAVGPGDVSKRIDVAATAIAARMTVDQVAQLDLCYAPPFSQAMDGLIVAANIVRNILDGLFDSVTPMQVKRELDSGKDVFMLDVRSPGECDEVRIPGSTNIPLGAIQNRLSELPKDKDIVAFCKISLRGYEAALKLQAGGFDRVRVMDGGIVMWPYEKEIGPQKP